MRRYTVVLMPEEDSYAVVVPVLPGVATQGETVPEALAAARDVIRTHLASLAADDEEIPEEEGPALVCVVDVD